MNEWDFTVLTNNGRHKIMILAGTRIRIFGVSLDVCDCEVGEQIAVLRQSFNRSVDLCQCEIGIIISAEKGPLFEVSQTQSQMKAQIQPHLSLHWLLYVNRIKALINELTKAKPSYKTPIICPSERFHHHRRILLLNIIETT